MAVLRTHRQVDDEQMDGEGSVMCRADDLQCSGPISL
jgi:hypothetical protein